MVESFKDLVTRRLTSRSGGNGELSGARVSPSEFLKVLLEGNATFLQALHVALEVCDPVLYSGEPLHAIKLVHHYVITS